jgi:hypothetical protein
MLTIERQHGAFFRDGISQHFLVWNCLISFPDFLNRQHVVPEPSKLFNNWQRKILIGLKQRHL